MRTMVRWNPFREMVRFDPLDFAPWLRDLPITPEREVAGVPMVRMDLAESATGYTVTAELPGVNKEDIAVSIDGGVVSMTAEVKREKEEKEGDKMLRSERYFGSVARAFSLPSDIDADKATATYEGGVLKLWLPKTVGATSTKLPIH